MRQRIFSFLKCSSLLEKSANIFENRRLKSNGRLYHDPLVIGATITRDSPLLVDPATGNLIAGISACRTPTQLRCVASYNIAANGPAGTTLNGISTYMSGEPFSIRSGVRTSNAAHESRAVVLDPNLRVQLQEIPGVAGPVLFPNNNGFAIPLPGQNGAGRNIFVAPGYYNLDIGIIKKFSIIERIKLDFRTEMFNVLNRADFDNPRDASVGSPSFRSSVFAQACCTTVAPPSTQAIIQTGESGRVIQFALKLKF